MLARVRRCAAPYARWTGSCIFDDILFFDKNNADKDEIENTQIRVAVYDADSFSRNDLIGSFTFDLSYVYFRKDHEFYRQWVAISDEIDVNDRGIQGYLLLSINVLGPDDSLPVHDLKAEQQAELARLNQGKPGRDAASLVLMPPTLIQHIEFLVVTVYKAQNLPNSDATLLSEGGIDGYVSVDFAGNPLAKTTVQTVKASEYGDLNPDWFEELWIPVRTPCMVSQVPGDARAKLPFKRTRH